MQRAMSLFDQLKFVCHFLQKKQMVIILTKDVYTDLTAARGELKEALRLAMANLTMAKQLIFDVVSKT